MMWILWNEIFVDLLGGEGESELCIDSWFCVLLTHFFLLPVVYIHTGRVVGCRGSLMATKDGDI